MSNWGNTSSTSSWIFEKSRDDAEGSWQSLCAALGGRGVESLADELKQQRFASLNAAFRAALQAVPDKASPAVPAEADDVLRAAQRFLSVLHAHLGRDSAGVDAVLKVISAWRGFMSVFRDDETCFQDRPDGTKQAAGTSGCPFGRPCAVGMAAPAACRSREPGDLRARLHPETHA